MKKSIISVIAAAAIASMATSSFAYDAKDYKQIVEKLEKGCQSNFEEDEAGNGTNADPTSREKEKDNGISCTNLGVVYKLGMGVERNLVKAAEYFKKGCDAKDGAGCNQLGTVYYSGAGVQPNEAEALALYQKACDLDYQRGCDNAKALSRKIR